MAKIPRRAFIALCGGAVSGATMLASPPLVALAYPFAPPANGGAGGLGDGEDPSLLTLAEASTRIHARTLTSTQLTQDLLARIALYNPNVNAYITVTS